MLGAATLALALARMPPLSVHYASPADGPTAFCDCVKALKYTHRCPHPYLATSNGLLVKTSGEVL